MKNRLRAWVLQHFLGLSAMLLVWPMAVIASPPNDQCGGAIALADGATYTMNTGGATSSGDIKPTCQTNCGKGVWFSFTPCADGFVIVSTCGSNFDTVLGAYLSHGAPCTVLEELNCNDNYCGSQSRVSFSGTAGVTYLIFVAGAGNASGQLRIVASSILPPVNNDQCANAVALSNGVTHTMCTRDASSTGDPQVVCGRTVGKGVWFSFQPCADGTVTVNTCGSNFDTAIEILRGECGTLTSVACSNSGCGTQAIAKFNGTAGVRYLVFAAGLNGASGMLRVAADVALPPPINDQCAAAVPLMAGVTLTTCTQGATAAGDPQFVCDITVIKGIWFTFTPSASGTVTVSTCGSDCDTVLGIYTGACGSLTQVVCDNGQSVWSWYGTRTNARASFNGIAGVQYRIFAGGFGNQSGLLRIVATQPVLPDLTVQSLTLNKTVFAPAEVGTATITLRNSGDSSTGDGFAVDLFRHAPDAVGCSATNPYKRIFCPALAAGATDTFTVPFSNYRAAGGYTLRVFADSTCLVSENSEANNQSVLNYSVVMPDLVIESLQLNKGTYGYSETATATVTVRNQGGTGTGIGYALDLFRHASGSLSCSPAGYYKRVERPALPAGDADTFSIRFANYPADGIYTLRVFADSTCLLNESNELNNQSTLNYTVFGGGQPDLVVQSVSLNKTKFSPGEVGTATITLKNQGSGSTLGGFNVDIFRHAPNAMGCNAISYYKRVPRPALAAGALSTFNVPYTNYIGTGNFVFRVFADSTCAISESSEGNNQATVSYSVGPSAGGASLGNTGTPTGE